MTDAIAMGRMIREARLRKGMSLGQLAAAVGRSSSSVRRWERGEVPPAIGIIDELASVLDLDPDELRGARPSADQDPSGDDTDDEDEPVDTSGATRAVEPLDGAEPAAEATKAAQRGFLSDVWLALRELTSDWHGWIRGLLTAAVLIVMLFILIWAVGELFDAIREVWDSFDTGGTEG